MRFSIPGLRALFLLPFLPALLACGSGEDEPAASEESAMSRIEGEVFYRERMLLPPGAELEVQLQDVSRADALATVMASVMSSAEGGPPYPFTIDYSPAEIDPRMRYSLRATISVGERLMFSSTEFIDPFSGEDIRIMVQRVPEPVDKHSPEVDPTEQAGEATDAAASEASSDGDSQLWLLATLGGEPAPSGAGGKPIDLLLDAETNTASGFSGCNRYTGSFSNEGRSSHGTPLSFGPLAGTMMACAEGAETERAYLEMLARVDAYRMQGTSLELLQGNQVLASFKMR